MMHGATVAAAAFIAFALLQPIARRAVRPPAPIRHRAAHSPSVSITRR